ncbi:MAG: hypothetical protein J2O48_09695, partial [Solirubrobacterales bacterium]|nr:hypothetical protein [Solirubrobacterales bacterium]
MSTRDIRPDHGYTPCDICGRTLLRGESAEIFIGGGTRHRVCELCKPQALSEGWIREGSVPDYDPEASAPERRRGLFGRRRQKRGGSRRAPTLDDALSGETWPANEQND